MIDFHSHSTFSDGELIPAELIRRARARGYEALAITDHGDPSNMDLIVPRLREVCVRIYEATGFTAFPGIELTHCPPSLIASLTEEARTLGAVIVVVHGETIVEPVTAGTNRAAIEAAVDILAHPGFISLAEAKAAAQQGVFLELTTRRGHSYTNGHVLQVARAGGASLIVNTDAHSPEDLTDWAWAFKIAAGAGMEREELAQLTMNASHLRDKLMARMRWE